MTTISREFRAEIGFTATPTTTVPKWVDVSEYVRDFSLTAGRSRELDRMESANATLLLDNEDGRFTPNRSTSPYYPNVKARRPVRAYSLLDGNFQHFETVNPPLGDLVNPRFEAVQGSTVTSISTVFDTTANRRVFEITGHGGIGQLAVFAGLISDVHHVTAGAQVTASASAPTGDIRVFLQEFDYTGALVAQTAAANTCSHVAVGSGYVRTGVTTTTSGTVTLRFHSMKLRTTGTGSAAAAGASGVYPEIVGYIERVQMNHDGKQSFTNLVINDASASLLNRPIRTSMRAGVAAALGDPDVGTAYHWPMVQAETDRAYLVSESGSGILNIPAGSSPDDTVWGFIDTPIVPNVDGASNTGCLEINMLTTTTFNDYLFKTTTPLGISLPTGQFAVNVWLDARLITSPPPEPEIVRFEGTGPDGAWFLSLTMDEIASDIQVIGTFTSPSGTSTTSFVIEAGVATNIGVSIVAGGGTQALYMYVDGVYSPGSAVTMGAITTLNSIEVCNIPTAPPETTYRVSNLVLAVAATSGGLIGDFHDQLRLAGTEDTDTEVQRIDRILDYAGWTQARALDDPLSDLLSARWDQGANAFEELQAAAEDAGGVAFVGPSGEVVYQNRTRRTTAAQKWRYPEWSDGVRVELDENRILNFVRTERTDGIFRTAQNLDSQDEYGVRGITVRRNVLDPLEMIDAANDLLARYVGDVPHCDVLTIDGTTMNGADQALRTNLVRNPSFEATTASWSITGGTLATSSVGIAQRGEKSARLTATGGAQCSIASSSLTNTPVTAGSTYTLSAYFRSAVTSRNCVVQVKWYDSSSALLSTSAGSAVASTTTGWVRPTVTAAAPVGAVYAVLEAVVQGTLAASEVHYVDAVLFEVAGSAGTYFDGYQPGYAFDGTIDASSSTTLNDSELLGLCHGVRLSDRLDVVGLPGEVSPDSGMMFFVDGYTFKATPVGSQWVFSRTMQLTPAGLGGAWILEGTGNNSLLDDVTCVLAY